MIMKVAAVFEEYWSCLSTKAAAATQSVFLLIVISILYGQQ